MGKQALQLRIRPQPLHGVLRKSLRKDHTIKTINARHVADMLDIASRNIRSRQNRERANLTPQEVASWILNIVMDLQDADSFTDAPSGKRKHEA